jgi:hypothetical protein
MEISCLLHLGLLLLENLSLPLVQLCLAHIGAGRSLSTTPPL